MNEPITILTRLIVWFQHCLVKAASLFLSILFTLSTGIVYANPTGGEVVSGSASISSSGNRMNINQSSDRAVLNWQDFSIGNNEQVNFNQPGKGSVALNRVVGANLSNIQGQLTANGNVFIINRNGVVFGANSRVDVNGLMATTSAISNDDFMAGRMNFTAPGGAVGSIVNEGTITVAQGGLVAFVAPSVRNAGVINARLGKVALAAGEQFTLDMYGDDLIKLAVSDALAKQLVENSGEINADGGVVSLTASQAKSAVDDVINMSGSIQAKSVAQRDGKIILSGGGGGVHVAGTLDSSSDSGVGGDIDVLGSRISLSDKATLNASGAGGGGEVHIGGDYQGKGQRPRASKTRISPGAQIMADATISGDGGRIIVWSDDHTNVDGSLSARGGKSGGDGGLIETSSAGKLDFSRQAKVEARGNGKPGTWLLDPEDITIGSGQANAISSTLNNGGNVSIKTAPQGSGEGNIKVNAAIKKTKGGNASLSMRAHNKIDVNAPITSTSGKLNVRLKAGRSINVNAKVSTNGGGFSTSITGVKPTESNEGNTNDTSTDDTKAQDETTEDQIADNSDDTQANESTESDQVAGTTDSKPTRPKSDRSKPKADERVADQGDDQATRDAVDQVQTTVATTVVTPEVIVSPPLVEPVNFGSTRTNTVPPATVATTATVPAVIEPKAQSVQVNVVQRSPVGVTINKVVNSGGGSIAIDAGNTGTATINSKLNASNTQSGKTGGNINVLGNKVVLTKKAKLDASGDAGGGDVKVGGAYQGKGSTRTAQTTKVSKGTTIKSNAITNGDGGEVVVWADKSTDYQGHIEAKGGKQGGDGGSVEVSGKQTLKFNGTVDTSAPKGKTGSLLLDPEDLVIKDINSNIYEENELSWKDLNDLGADNNVNIKVDGKVDIEKFKIGTVTLVHELGKTVSFEAGNDITFADTTDTLETSGASLMFNSIGGALELGSLITKGGNVDLTAGGDISLQKIDAANTTRELINGTSVFQYNGAGDINVVSKGQNGVTLNQSIFTGIAIIDIEAKNGNIESTNKDVVLDTTAANSTRDALFGTERTRAGNIILLAEKIFLMENSETIATNPTGGLPTMIPKPNIIAKNYEITATQGDGDEIVGAEYISTNSTPAIRVRLGQADSPDPTEDVAGLVDDAGNPVTFGDLYPSSKNIKSIIRIGDVTYQPDGVFFITYSGDTVGTAYILAVPNFFDSTGTNPRFAVIPIANANNTINCPPCITLPGPEVVVFAPAIVDTLLPTPVSPPAQPEIAIIESIASSAEIDRDYDRQLIRSNDEGDVDVSTLLDEECAEFDALNWLASGPRDAASSVDLGRSSGQSSQSDIARMAACLTRDSQASL